MLLEFKNDNDNEILNEVISQVQLHNFIAELPNGLQTNVGERGVATLRKAKSIYVIGNASSPLAQVQKF